MKIERMNIKEYKAKIKKIGKKCTEKPVKRKSHEHDMQKSIFKYIEKVLPDLRPFIFAIPNGGKRNVIVAKKLKAEGVTSGVWDIFVSIPNLVKHGLYVEIKVGSNGLTENQKYFRKNIERLGYVFGIAKCIDDFNAILENYFELEELNNKEIKTIIGLEYFIQRKCEYKAS